MLKGRNMREGAEKEAERYFGKIVLLLSEAGDRGLELSFLAKMLYINPEKLRYWLIKRGFWNDLITVRKKGNEWFVYLEGSNRGWLALFFELSSPQPTPEMGNEVFKKMVSIGSSERAIFAQKLKDGSLSFYEYYGPAKRFLVIITLKPNEAMANGEIHVELNKPEIWKRLEEAVALLDLKVSNLHFNALAVVKIEGALLERCLREPVVIKVKEE
jgi:hypothetical protein